MAEEKEITKIDLLPMLRLGLKQIRRTWLLALVLLLITGLFGVWQVKRTYTPSYRISASFIVNTSSNEITNQSYYDKVTTEQLNQTFPYILTSGALEQIICEDMGVTVLPGRIAASSLGETNLFQITVTGSDPEKIARELDSVIENYPQVAKYIIGTTQLKLLEKQDVPTVPANQPAYRQTLLRYGAIALALYLLFLLYCVLTNRTVLDKHMLHRYSNLKSLGSLPKVRQAKRKKRRPLLLTDENISGAYVDALASVQARVEHKLKDHHMKAIYITSSIASEGKTTTACNLAILMAQRGKKVLLIDGDLRNPSVAYNLGMEEVKRQGLVDVLKKQAEQESCILPSEAVPGLWVLPGGAAVSRIGDLYTNGEFAGLIEEWKSKVDLIIVDTPPCSFLHDTSVIAERLDGGFLIIRQEYAPIDRVVAGIELLSKTEAPLFGYVMNCSADGGSHYGYGYGYGYGAGKGKK